MDGAIAGASIVCAVGIDALDGRLDLFEQAGQGAWINHVLIRQQSNDNLLRVGIQTDVQFAPGAALAGFMGFDEPLAFAEDFKTGGVKDKVFDGFFRWRGESELEEASASGEQRVMWGGQVEVEHPKDGRGKALSLT